MSLDGKISTGCGDKMDFDRDIPKIVGAGVGLGQYYDYEQTTDPHSMTSGKVWAKLGINKKQTVNKMPVSFIVIDNKNLTKTGVENLIKKSTHLYIVTTNREHSAFLCKADNMTVLYCGKELDFGDHFSRLYGEFGIRRITIQTGGTLNTQFVRAGCVDEVSVFVAPLLVGGRNTPTLMDGESLKSVNDLAKIKAMQLISVSKLNNSYIHIRYRVTDTAY
jgi:2,5-diamino-6-(ribosylamino)-4(3H)-pyrimidinone 5'-phosphate reductase